MNKHLPETPSPGGSAAPFGTEPRRPFRIVWVLAAIYVAWLGVLAWLAWLRARGQ